MSVSEGHRDRLRKRFRESPGSLTEAERLELLLTYAIPRRDVAPLATTLIARFGDLKSVVDAPVEQLAEVNGVGEATAAFFHLLQMLTADSSTKSDEVPASSLPQPWLFEMKQGVDEQPSSTTEKSREQAVKERQMRVFANDEIANSLAFLPKAAKFRSLEDYREYLTERLPYNAADTRRRRANYIIERFYPEGSLSVPLTSYAARCSTQSDLGAAVFYHLLKAEPIAAKVAEELIWSALPMGRVEREQVREFVLRYLPEIGSSSQKNVLQALFHAYDLLNVGKVHETSLSFRLHQGTLEGYLYVLTCEYPEPGIYTFDSLYAGPLHRWLLWDREWMRLQLYNLQDLGIVAKVSEIDTVRQFTLALDQPTALHRYFEHPARHTAAVREVGPNQSTVEEA